MADRLILVRTESQYQLASTFLRFQEHYESPRFRGKIFSIEEFMDWYAKEYDGKFTYYEDWHGFNMPSRVFVPFRKGRFDPLSRKEQRILDLLKSVPEPFYLVGLYGNEMNLPDLKHELIHGLYHTVPAYRTEVRLIVRDLGRNSLIFKALKHAGYHQKVHQDEANAYLLMGAGSDLSEDGFHWTAALQKCRKELQETFRRHFGFSLHRANEKKITNFFRTIWLDI